MKQRRFDQTIGLTAADTRQTRESKIVGELKTHVGFSEHLLSDNLDRQYSTLIRFKIIYYYGVSNIMFNHLFNPLIL